MKKIDLLYLTVVMFYLISGLIKWNITTIFACVLSLIFMVITNVISKKIGFGNGIKILIYVFILGTEILGEIYHFYVYRRQTTHYVYVYFWNYMICSYLYCPPTLCHFIQRSD